MYVYVYVHTYYTKYFNAEMLVIKFHRKAAREFGNGEGQAAAAAAAAGLPVPAD